MVIQKVSSKRQRNRQSKKKTSVRTNLQPNEQTAQYNDYNELITDDESSFNLRRRKDSKKIKRLLSTSSEDEAFEQGVYNPKSVYVDVVPRNKEQMPEQITKSLLNDKQSEEVQKVTPCKTNKMQSSISVSCIHTSSHAQNLWNYPKALTASGANIVTNMDSFIQPPKSINQDEKRRHEEDATKEREDEGLRLWTEKERR
ncbi:inner centromere protein b [Lasius niger]|uniref:Inner centromere protein b n=1 Tax=Lasius niger TaxID=67767 RepID=A0A0J7K8N0_LASNI|nr:inner centromere protein b [Lasius niger]